MRGRRRSAKITESEWAIMSVIWHGYELEGRGLTLGEILSELERTSVDWTSNTVRTFVIRLSEKGAVEIDRTTGIYKYSPRITRDDCYDAEVDAFLKRVFDGSESALLKYIIGRENLTPDEKSEMISLLEGK